MRTREVLGWNCTARELAEVALLAAAGAALVALSRACDRLERWVDARAVRGAS